MYGFRAFLFEGKKTAGKALETIDEQTAAYAWLDDVAEVSRSKHGSIRIHSTWAQDDSEVGGGAAFGALTGGMIGLLFGPGGAMAGAAVGSSLGALFGVADELALDDPALDEFADKLGNDTSALVLLAEDPALSEFVAAVEPLGGKIVQTNLNEKDVKAIRKALKKSS